MYIWLHLLVLTSLYVIGYAEYNPLVRVIGDHSRSFQRDQRKQRDSSSPMRWNRHRGSSASDIIFAPLADERIITKERMYMNVNAEDSDVYEQRRRIDVETLDPVFVTAPPARTTVAVRFDLPESTTDIVVNGGRGDALETALSPLKPSVRQTGYGTPSPLKLVTLPPVATTPLPPFKYTKPPAVIDNIQFRPPPPANVDRTQTSLVRFPAQPWQIPPRDPLRAPPNLFTQLFEVTPAPGFPPANPFANLLNLPQSGITNPLNLTAYPFLPIGTSNPPWTASGAIPQQQQLHQMPIQGYMHREIDSQMIHKSPLRVGFSKTREIDSIPPLPFGGEELGPPTNMKPPVEEFSIDSRPQIDKMDFQQPFMPYKPSAKTFVTEKKSRFISIDGTIPRSKTENLREYMKNHPHMVNSIYSPQPSKPVQGIAAPQPYQTTTIRPYTQPAVQPSPIVPIRPTIGGPSLTSMTSMMSSSSSASASSSASSGLNPNQKLALCCRKQQVSSTCQSLCDFDAFSDKTLVSAFLTNQCPGPQLGKAYDCASSKADHTSCCQAAGLQTFLGGRCMPFCKTHQATPANVLEYISCLQVFETIKNCYRQYQYTNKNIFGD